MDYLHRQKKLAFKQQNRSRSCIVINIKCNLVLGLHKIGQEHNRKGHYPPAIIGLVHKQCGPGVHNLSQFKSSKMPARYSNDTLPSPRFGHLTPMKCRILLLPLWKLERFVPILQCLLNQGSSGSEVEVVWEGVPGNWSVPHTKLVCVARHGSQIPLSPDLLRLMIIDFYATTQSKWQHS